MITKYVLALTLAASSVGAQAACSSKDVVGRWDGVVTGTNYNVIQKCQFTINKGGSLTSGYCLNPDGSQDYLSGGAISVARDCVVNGSLLYSNGILANLIGNMSRGKDTAIGFFNNNSGLYGTFSAVRY
jgi:hypothetical protein